ncbi:MAG: phosphodiester glycosidase family protein [Gemmatimonadota bacterium]|nr:phosphodiester glycosidase family protein [Gemmatimonadota bacterium]MDE2870653.1 phosphodiester glycosidase family protein [Gemmatimonadota bacterium]
MFAAALLALTNCAAPDREIGADRSLPAAALSWLEPDSLHNEPLGDGVFYHFVWSAGGPWAVHLVSADLTRCDLKLVVVPALEEDGVTRTRKAVTAMIPRGDATPLAGVNGDFFSMDGSPVGPEVTATTRRSSSRPAIAWDSGRIPRIGPGTAFGRDSVSAAGLQVLGGFPELLDEGARVEDLAVAERPRFAAARHPRTAVGYDSEGSLLWLVVVDGRRLSHSVGMTLPELTGLFEALGAAEALNLDGGGSSAMALGKRLVSNPSDVAGERPVGNSLWLVRDGSGCDIAQLRSPTVSHLTVNPTWPPRSGPGSKYRPPKAFTTTEEA